MPKICLLLLICWVAPQVAPLWGQSSPPPEILKAELQELKTVVRTLRNENLKLESRNEQLMLDVVNLGRQIRSLQARIDSNEIEDVSRSSEPNSAQPVAVRSGMFKAIYVNPTWHYLLVDAGSNDQIQVGDTGSVVRNGNIIAKINITDVKPTQSVADLDVSSLAEQGIYPKTNDQVTFP